MTYFFIFFFVDSGILNAVLAYACLRATKNWSVAYVSIQSAL